MAVRFVIGRAGSGKTHHCLESIRQRLRIDALNGPRLILLVPEQASQQAERAILIPPDPTCSDVPIEASHRAEVFSFKRLADRVLESACASPLTNLSESARVMVLRHLVAANSAKLTYYRRVDRFGGFFQRLAATITELIQEDVSPGDLIHSTAAPELSTRSIRFSDPAHKAKIHDLALIYAAYLAHLGADRLDPSQHLERARTCLLQCEWLHGAELWVDGFASMSGQEVRTLLTLAGICCHVEIAVLLDPSQAFARSQRSGSDRLFTRTLRWYQDLRREFANAGIAEDEPLILQPSRSPRFLRSPMLSHLEARLSGSRIVGHKDSPGATTESTVMEGVAVVELPSRRVEVEYAVARVCEWTRSTTPKYRWRDIALIVRDLEPYHDLISEAFDARGIPYFVDRRRPIAHHPLVELLRAGPALAVENMSIESVRLLLKTSLTPLSSEQCDELENYLLAHGIRGIDAWSASDWSFRRSFAIDRRNEELSPFDRAAINRINVARRCVVDFSHAWLQFARDQSGHTGGEWAYGIRQWMERLGVAASLRRWISQAEESGELDHAQEHRHAWSAVDDLLDDLAGAFSDQRLDLEEIAAVLEVGLGELTLGLVPPTVDQVLVGSIERSRHPDIKAAIVLGFNDGVFPARIVEDTILNDSDREALSDAELRIGPPARQRVLDESMLVYIAMTRASEELVVTFARANDDGGALRPSPFIESLKRAVPNLDVIAVADSTPDRNMWDIQTAGDCRVRLAMEFRSRPPRDRDNDGTRGRWNELYESVRIELGRDPVTQAGWSSLGHRKEASLSQATIGRLLPTTMRTSVSRLESYAACPFKYFSEHVLCLRERAEAEIAAVDVGLVHHAILEDYARDLASRRQGTTQGTEADLMRALRESCERVATRLPPGGELSDARNAYMLRRSAGRLARVIRAQYRANQANRRRPRAAELSFGMGDDEGLPALELSTPTGRRVVLRGFIDRVDLIEAADDLLGVVVDYKDTRDKRLDLSKAYHGLSLQLLAYLLVLAEKGETLAGRPIRPAGALYLSLAPRYHKVDHPSLASERELSQAGTYRARGLLLADRLGDLGIESEPGRWSPHFAVYRKKDSSLGRLDQSDVTEQPAFDAILSETRARLGELADEILNGEIPVRPCRLGSFSPCSWCTMASVCRFEMGLCDVRFLETLKRSEVFRRLTGAGAASR